MQTVATLSILVGLFSAMLHGISAQEAVTAPITKADFCKQPELPCSLPGFIYHEQSQDWEEITANPGPNYPHYTIYDDCAPYGSSRFKVVMGCNTDFYKPKPGETLCNALDSTSKFLWSATLDGDYVDAGDYGYYKGGSSMNWPKNNVEGDDRWLLPIWGGHSKPAGGCCHVTKFNCLEEIKYEQGFHDWGRAFKIFAYVGSPSKSLSTSPSKSPFKSLSMLPSKSPSKFLSTSPSKSPSKSPSESSSKSPVKSPSKSPSKSLSKSPSKSPSKYCIDSPYKAKMKMSGDGSKILLSCNNIDVSLNGKTFCKSNGKLATHCPLSCGTCDTGAYADSTATFLYDAETGKTKRCTWLQGLTKEKRDKKCANESLKMTCRASCN